MKAFIAKWLVEILMATVFVLSVATIVTSCGDSSEVVEYKDKPAKEQPKPEPKPKPGEKPTDPVTEPEVSAKDKAFAAVASNCATCHNSGFQSPPLENQGQILAKVDRICNRVGNGTMPPGGNISEIAKIQILNGLCR